MQAFAIFLFTLACASAKPQLFYGGFPFGGAIQYSAPAITYQTTAPVVYTAPTFVAPAVSKFQYHSQDELGQASWGYGHPGQAHSEVRGLNGVTGSYAYIGADGKEVRTNYVADANGFRVASNALPVAPGIPEAPVLVGPAPVQDTPEVAEAKAAHQKAIEEAQARNAEADKKDAAEGIKTEEPKAEEVKAEEQPAASRRKRSLIATPVVAYSSPLVHSLGAVTYSSPLTYSSHIVHSNVVAAPLTYSAIPALTQVVTSPVRPATLTKVVNTPGHAISYRVDK